LFSQIAARRLEPTREGLGSRPSAGGLGHRSCVGRRIHALFRASFWLSSTLDPCWVDIRMQCPTLDWDRWVAIRVGILCYLPNYYSTPNIF